MWHKKKDSPQLLYFTTVLLTKNHDKAYKLMKNNEYQWNLITILFSWLFLNAGYFSLILIMFNNKDEK